MSKSGKQFFELVFNIKMIVVVLLALVLLLFDRAELLMKKWAGLVNDAAAKSRAETVIAKDGSCRGKLQEVEQQRILEEKNIAPPQKSKKQQAPHLRKGDSKQGNSKQRITGTSRDKILTAEM